MKVEFYRTLIAAVLLTVHLFSGVSLQAHEPEPGNLAECGMACCAEGGCECEAAPRESEPKPMPAVPVPAKPELKFLPLLVSVLTVPADCAEAIVCSVRQETGSVLTRHGPRIFRLHCSLLM